MVGSEWLPYLGRSRRRTRSCSPCCRSSHCRALSPSRSRFRCNSRNPLARTRRQGPLDLFKRQRKRGRVKDFLDKQRQRPLDLMPARQDGQQGNRKPLLSTQQWQVSDWQPSRRTSPLQFWVLGMQVPFLFAQKFLSMHTVGSGGENGGGKERRNDMAFRGFK